MKLRSIYLFVENLSETTHFYRRLGLEIELVSASFARASWGNRVFLEFGTDELTTSYDPSWEAPGAISKGTINFELSADADVDKIYNSMLDAGFDGHLAPCDPPWQARFAILKDPDGNFVGLNGTRTLVEDRDRERSR